MGPITSHVQPLCGIEYLHLHSHPTHILLHCLLNAHAFFFAYLFKLSNPKEVTSLKRDNICTLEVVELVKEVKVINMEVVEDDLFFADLSKRISLLIMDDDEDPTLYCPPVSFQVLSQTIHTNHNQIPSFNEQNGRREIKGTGVFIPQSSTNSRRSKQSRSKSSNTRNHQSQTQSQSQRHVIASSGHFPHEPYNNQNTNYTYNSLNHKRSLIN